MFRFNKAIRPNTCWFQNHSFCRYSTLPVYNPESYVSRHPGADYRINLARLGDRILLVKSSGYVRSFEMDEEIEFTSKYIATHFQANSGLIVIEDYTDVGGSDSKARKKYIDFHRTLHYSGPFIGSILYNMSTLFKISFKVAQRLQIHDENAFAADTYEQSLDIAHKLIQQYDQENSQKDIPHNYIKDIDIHGSHEKSLSESNGWINRINSMFKRFRLNRSVRGNEKQIEHFSQSLLNYIHSIDWHKDGFDPFDSSVYDNQTLRNVFDAISFVKSEVDSLMHERSENERDLRISEKKYRQIVELASAGILEFDLPSRRFISVNEYFQMITGYSKEELLSMNPIDLLTNESRNDFVRHLSMINSSEEFSEKIVYQINSKQGEIKWVMVHSHFSYDHGQPQKANVVLSDITPLKLTENQLLEYQRRLKKLSIQLSMTEENQRREMASVLHDQISQELFGVYLQLNTLEDDLKKTGYAHKLEQIKSQQLDVIKAARALTFDLSPPVLYDLGLGEAVKSLGNAVQIKHGLNVQTQFSGDLDDIRDEIKIILFRNIKELLHNIVKYAQANSARIDIFNRKKGLYVEVADNGIGFDVSHAIRDTSSNNGFGLFDIKEKMNHLGGSVSIESSANTGTIICMNVPSGTDIEHETKN